MKHYAVIGKPIKHSLSPLMHEANFKALDIQATYNALLIESLENEMPKLKQLDGFNITVPHKERIMSYLDTIDPLALQVGAVNTVKKVDGRLIGYNTDVEGFYECFSKYKIFKHAPILILGAGGASKAVFYGLQSHGYKNITVANRTLSRARLLTDHALTLEDAQASLHHYDVVINTTSVGLTLGECPIKLNKLMSKTLVMDLIYKPKETTLLTEARLMGCQTENGLEMLLNQGAKAFEIWQGIPANKSAMLQQLEEAIYAIR